MYSFNWKLFLQLIVCVVGLAACATKGPPKILSREGDNDAVVYLPNTAIKQGDHLLLMSERCPQAKSACNKTPVGHATVIQRLNDKYARVRFDRATEIYEGQPVEEHVH
jgi:hypothetical protein